MSDLKVIFGDDNAERLRKTNTVLELDTFFQEGLREPISTHAVIDITHLKVDDFQQLSSFVELHNTMMAEYRKRNWRYCTQAAEMLVGKWNGVLDEFYNHMIERVAELEANPPDDDWTGVITTQPN